MNQHLPKNILVTGGAGYIGSHTCVELIQAGYDVVVYDNFSNSRPAVLKRIESITGKALKWVCGDIRDQYKLEETLTRYACEAVVHFAGLKAVGESVAEPLRYYDNNVVGTLRLLEAMVTTGIHSLVFSSSATVYGDPICLPIKEDHPLSATNPYGRTKLMIEEILRDLQKASPEWRISILRYFNPVGAHESGRIGEDPRGTPNNLMPFIAQVAVGRRDALNVFGTDYPTPDGTGVRDYIHVVDLAKGHLSALSHLNESGCYEVNLGTGQGYSVLEVVAAFERAASRKIPVTFAVRRPGDVASCFAHPEKASNALGWKATLDIDAMCRDHWRWQVNNPEGYELD